VTGSMIYTYQMEVMDAVVFTEIAIIFAIEAMETNKFALYAPRVKTPLVLRNTSSVATK